MVVPMTASANFMALAHGAVRQQRHPWQKQAVAAALTTLLQSR